jgi:hypothetical protein
VETRLLHRSNQLQTTTIMGTHKHYPKGLDGRMQDADGEIHKKRGDTLVKTLRKTYGPDFAPGVRADTRLDTLRKRAGDESLSKIIKRK